MEATVLIAAPPPEEEEAAARAALFDTEAAWMPPDCEEVDQSRDIGGYISSENVNVPSPRSRKMNVPQNSRMAACISCLKDAMNEPSGFFMSRAMRETTIVRRGIDGSRGGLFLSCPLAVLDLGLLLE